MPQKIRCQVAEIEEHGERVYSVLLKPLTAAPRFRPGQFLHLALDEYTQGDFWPDSRSFSIASPPTVRHLLRITYAVKGRFTARMEAELITGREVWVKMPYGEFVVSSDKNVCLLAGGTGITAFTAFLSELPRNHPWQIHLFYGARQPELLIYRDQAEQAAKTCPNLRVRYLVEEGPTGKDYLLGRIEAQTVFRLIPEPSSIIYYLAGPPGMIHDLTDGLSRLGVASNQILADAWE